MQLAQPGRVDPPDVGDDPLDHRPLDRRPLGPRPLGSAHDRHRDVHPVERLRLLFREQVLIVVRDYPDFLPLFVKIRLPAADLRERLLELRRDHEAVFQRATEQVRVAHDVDRVTTSLSLRVAFGALAYLPDWFDPDGPLGVQELADRIAATLTGPFLVSGA